MNKALRILLTCFLVATLLQLFPNIQGSSTVLAASSRFQVSEGLQWTDGTPIIENIRGVVSPSKLSPKQLQTLGRLSAQGEVLSFNTGDKHTFITHNFVTNQNENVDATLKAKGQHSYIWVADNQTVDDSVISNIMQEYDNKIYSKDVEYFGNPPDRDQDPLIHILLLDIKDGYTGQPPHNTFTAGYFDPADQAGQNNMDMFYMDTNPGTPGSSLFYSTLAHEFQHMINFNMHPGHNEESWVNEGLSDYAILVCGYGIPWGHVDAFAANPTLPLTAAFDNSLERYGESFLFVEYLTELVQRNGKPISDFTKSWENQDKVGIDGINALLPNYLDNGKNTFEKVYKLWVIANILQSGSGDYGYRYSGLSFNINTNTNSYQGTKITLNGNMLTYATNYFDLSPDQNHTSYTITVDAPVTANYNIKVLKSQNGTLQIDQNIGLNSNLLPPKLTGSLELNGVYSNNQDRVFLVISRLDSSVGSGGYSTFVDATTLDKGLNFLHQQHNGSSDGSWSSNVGITSLATLAFLNNGYHETDPDVQRGIQYILASKKPDGEMYSYESTYETSMAILALKATHNPAYDSTIATAKNWLVSTQWSENPPFSINTSNPYYGGFGYGHEERPDLSNTQFALLALKAAGLPSNDPTWAKAIKFVTRCQNYNGGGGNDQSWAANDGGFIYLPGTSLAGGTASYGSMTGAGVWGLALSGVSSSDPRYQAALRWVDNNYSWDYVPMTGGSWGNYNLYYYYLSMSKGLSMAHKINVGGFLGIGAHDWYKELTNKLTTLQQSNGSWVNSESWFWETDPNLATSYSLLALQTRQLPKNANLVMSIILHSPADLHLYDAAGNHVGKNYVTGGIDLQIPGASYSSEDPQTLTIQQPEAGNYHLELVGTGTGDWQVEVVGTQDGVQVSYDTYTGTINQGTTLSTDLNVGAFDGGLTIFSSQPITAPVMSLDPDTLTFTGQTNETLHASFNVKEVGNGSAIQGTSGFASDLADGSGNIISASNISISPSGFDVPAGGSQKVDVAISIPDGQPDGKYTGTLTIESTNAGAKSVQLSVQVISIAPPALTIPGDQTVQYSDSMNFGISATDPNAADKLVINAYGLPDGLAFTDNGDRTGTVSGIVTAAPGKYPVQFIVTDPTNLTDTKSLVINVVQEDARTTYTGPMLISTANAKTSKVTVPLQATIQDITATLSDPSFDQYPGDITHATVSFVDRGNSNKVLCTSNVTLIDSDTKTGTAACNWTVDIGSNMAVDYTVGVVVSEYYTRDSGDEDAEVVVSKPGANFIAGGGFITNQNSGGKYAGDAGKLTRFGLALAYVPKRPTVTGRLTIIVRSNGHTYWIRSTGFSSLVATPFNPAKLTTGTAELLGKATIIDVTNMRKPVVVALNAKLQVSMKDNGEPGKTDTISISLWDTSGKLLFSSNWNGAKTILQTLSGGNLIVK